MKIIRRLLLAGLSVIVILACVVGTACLVKRQVYVAICDAFPVAIDGPIAAAVDLDLNMPETPGEPSGNAYIVSQPEPANDEAARAQVQHDRAQAAIEEGLRDASPEEREIWLSELKDQSPEDIREILSLHRRLTPPQMLPGGIRLQEGDRIRLMLAEEAPPQLFQPDGNALQPGFISPARGTDDALCLLESSIKAIQSAEQVILNNIANANTAGFKRSRVLFGDESYRHVAPPGQIDQQGRPTTSGIALGAGSRILANQIDVSQGRLRRTQQPLDLAIQGEGYFQINDGARILYTRAGTFTVNSNGEVVLASKDRARPLDPAITIPQGVEKIMICPEGIVSILQQGQSQITQIGQIQLARFINPQGLIARGENLFEQTTATGAPRADTPGQNGTGEIRQGCLEESNVVVADELAELRQMQEQLKTLQQLQIELGGSAR